MVPLIGYIRVSTADQAAHGASLDAQRAALVQWAQTRGATIEIHSDAGLSAKRADNRPGLATALARACELRCPFVVYSLSRAARSIIDAAQMLDRLRAAGADFVSVTEAIDTTSAAGRMMFGLLAVFAQFERELICERTRAALEVKRARGERTGHRRFGSADGPANEAWALERMKRLRARGKSLRFIADYMQRSGVAPARGAGRWLHSSVKSILSRN